MLTGRLTQSTRSSSSQACSIPKSPGHTPFMRMVRMHAKPNITEAVRSGYLISTRLHLLEWGVWDVFAHVLRPADHKSRAESFSRLDLAEALRSWSEQRVIGQESRTARYFVIFGYNMVIFE